MNFAAKTDKGKIRDNNEDFYCVKDNLLIIADGMGGHNAGEVASKIAVETAKSVLCGIKEDYEEKIGEAISKANSTVFGMATDERAGMGTTMDVCIYAAGKIYLGHVGDSRVYLVRDGVLKQLTNDHSYVEMLLSKGEITKEEADNYPMKNMITRAIGVGESVKCDFYTTKVSKDDKLFLCTDGLTNMIDDKKIADIINSSESLDIAVERLVENAIEAGGKDNITVILAEGF